MIRAANGDWAARLKLRVGQALVPAARLWIRYAPVRFLKQRLWRGFNWRRHWYSARTRFGCRIRGDTGDIVQRYLYYFGIWEPDLTSWIARRLAPGEVFVDVGANVGYFTLLAASVVGDRGRVVAVEPSAPIMERLRRNVSLNGFTNVRTVCAAATAARGRVVIYGDEENPSHATIVKGVGMGTGPTEVEGVPLADVLLPDELRRTRLVKIDVEGAEHLALSGLQNALVELPSSAELIVEITPERLAVQGVTPEDIIGMMSDRGFLPYFLDNDYAFSRYMAVGRVASPTRLARRIERETLIVFSRIDADHL